MAENKTQRTDASVADFLAAIPDPDRRLTRAAGGDHHAAFYLALLRRPSRSSRGSGARRVATPDLAMAIVPILHCRNMQSALTFYTRILDFERVGGDGRTDDPAYSVLARGGDYLILSSHEGDGRVPQAVVVTTNDVDVDWRLFRDRGLTLPAKAGAKSPVHAGPLEQTWGTREVYVDDPDGNTLRFTQRWFD